MKRIVISTLLVTVCVAKGHAQFVTYGYDDRFLPAIENYNRNYEFDEEGKSNDFGVDITLEASKKLTSRLDLSLGLNMRTQDNNRDMERRMLTLGLGYKLIDTKKFDLKAGFDFDYYGVKKLSSTEYFEKFDIHYKDDDPTTPNGYNYRKGYKVTDSYWRGRERYSLSLSASYKPSKRWTFTIKETLQYSHYNRTDSLSRTRITTERHKWREAYVIDDLPDAPAYDLPSDTETMLYYDQNINGLNNDGDLFPLGETAVYDSYGKEVYPAKGRSVPYADEDLKKPRTAKDRLILRSRLTVEYNIRGVPLNPFVSVDYGCGLNYHAWKMKYTVGMDWKVNKMHKITLFYRYQHENDDDEPNGQLIGLGYKINL